VALVPPLRRQAGIQTGLGPSPPLTLVFALSSFFPPPPSEAGGPPLQFVAWLEPYRRRCVAFVEQHYPNDPEMLMAAASLAPEQETEARLPLLARAVELGGGPAAWSAYVTLLFADESCSYMRVGTQGGDPADSQQMEWQRQYILESGAPTMLLEDRVAPVLDALRGWEEEDPQNALPLALEMQLLYGLHRDRETMARWVEAGRLPVVRDYRDDRARAVALLLSRMGVAPPEAMLGRWIPAYPTPLATVRTSARIAYYEGGLAQIDGRSADAIAWWNATMDSGLHLQQSADSMVAFMVGVSLQAIGASPAWKWRPDGMTGIPGGPLRDGRYFHGPHHDFYVAQRGEKASADLRDSLLRARVRSDMLREYAADPARPNPIGHTRRHLALGQLVAFQLLPMALLAILLAVWPGQRASPVAVRLRPWQIIAIALAVCSATAVGIATGGVPLPTFSPSSSVHVQPPLPLTAPFPSLAWLKETFLRGVLAGPQPVAQLPYYPFMGISAVLLVAFPAGALLLATLFAALLAPRPRPRLLTAWRRNLRPLLPPALALGAVLYLALSLSAIKSRADYARHWLSPGVTDMDYFRDALGNEWTHPTIPPDSYRAEHPPVAR
jgi:hypothetical protein